MTLPVGLATVEQERLAGPPDSPVDIEHSRIRHADATRTVMCGAGHSDPLATKRPEQVKAQIWVDEQVGLPRKHVRDSVGEVDRRGDALQWSQFEVGEQWHAQADPIDDGAHCAGLLHEAVLGSAVVEADLVYRSNLAGTADAVIDKFLKPVRGMFEPGDPKVHVRRMFGSGDLVAAETEAIGAVEVVDRTEAVIRSTLDGSVSPDRAAYIQSTSSDAPLSAGRSHVGQ